MNQDIFAGQWKQMRGAVRSWWGKLTDADFDKIGGQADKLIGWVQEKYGYTREKAQQEVERHLKEYDDTKSGSSGSGGGNTMESTSQDLAQDAAEAVGGMKVQVQELASTAASTAREATAAVGEQMGALAGMIRENAPQTGAVGVAATAVADRMDAAGTYLHEHGFAQMATDLRALIRRYPLQSFLLGLGLGYVLTRRTGR